MSEGPSKRRLGRTLLAAGVAGIIAGTAAVYVRESGNSNGGAVNAACAGALETAKKIEPFAKGEVAAFRPAVAAEQFSELVFKTPEGADTGIAGFAGKVILVNLWATWCVPCRAEMPALDRLEGALGGDGFSVVAVNVDVKDPERAKEFLADIGVTRLAFYSDPTLGMFNALKRRGMAFGLPTSLLIDGKGCRLGTVEGPAAWDSEDAKALIRAATGAGAGQAT